MGCLSLEPPPMYEQQGMFSVVEGCLALQLSQQRFCASCCPRIAS